MTELEEIVRHNRALADYMEPLPGHEKRFFLRSKVIPVTNYQVYYLTGLLVAASVLIALLLFKSMGTVNNNRVLVNMPEEVSEAIFYYDSRSYKLQEEIKKYIMDDTTEYKRIQQDIRLMEKWQKSIFTDYKRFPEDERVWNALIEIHRNKAEILDDLVEKIKRTEYSNI